jgi:hypothetical protein
MSSNIARARSEHTAAAQADPASCERDSTAWGGPLPSDGQWVQRQGLPNGRPAMSLRDGVQFPELELTAEIRAGVLVPDGIAGLMPHSSALCEVGLVAGKDDGRGQDPQQLHTPPRYGSAGTGASECQGPIATSRVESASRPAPAFFSAEMPSRSCDQHLRLRLGRYLSDCRRSVFPICGQLRILRAHRIYRHGEAATPLLTARSS